MTSPTENAAAEARTIAADGENVRERIRRTFVETVRGGKIDLGKLGDVAEAMVKAGVEGVRECVPEKQDGVLGEVVDGIGDGLSVSANATRLALQEARGRGETFASEDLKRAVDDLKSLEQMLLDTVSRASKSAASHASAQMKGLFEHAQSTARQVRPNVETALAEAAKHPVKMAGETAATAAKVVPRAAGMLLQSMSGLLQGAGELLAGEEKDGEEKA